MLLGIEIALIEESLITLNSPFALMVKNVFVAKSIGWLFVVEITSWMFSTIFFTIREFIYELEQ